MKITDFDQFLRRDLKTAAIVLVHGVDTGLVAERTKAIIAAALDNPDDPFQLVRLDGDEVAGDPARLADEALTIGLFGGRRVIAVRLGGKAIHGAVQPLASDPPRDALIVIEGGDLKKTHPLRAIAEKSPAIASIVCYGDESRSLGALASSTLQQAGLSIDREALETLIAALGGDRLASRSELTKLVLYCHGRDRVEEADIDAVITDVSALESSQLVDAVYGGNLIGIENRSERLFAEGLDPGVLLGAALRHGLVLKRLLARGVRGKDQLAPLATAAGIYFKRHDALLGQLQRWPVAAIDRAIAQLSQAVRQIRRTPRLGEAIAVRALWSIALAARRSG